MNVSRALVCLGLTLLTSPAFAQGVNVNWDENADFEGFETFAWLKGTRVPNPVSHQRIVSAIENQLGIKGFWENPDGPDMYIVYHASAKEQVNLDSPGYRTDWRSNASIQVRSYLAGTLVVDVLDAKNKRLLWRGTATKTIDENPQKNQTLISDTIEEMFEQFPPGG